MSTSKIIIVLEELRFTYLPTLNPGRELAIGYLLSLLNCSYEILLFNSIAELFLYIPAVHITYAQTKQIYTRKLHISLKLHQTVKIK